MNSDILLLILFGSFSMAAPLIAAAYGGLFSERSGVVNIGIEGMMTAGAFSGATVAYFIGNAGINGSITIGFIVAILIGGLTGLLHAYLCISLKVDQIISGVAINTITLALSLFLTAIYFDGAQETHTLLIRPIAYFSNRLTLVTIIRFLLVFAVNYLLNKTKWGLHVLAVGENPQAADAMGINVIKTRYQAVILSGAFSGLAGMVAVVNVTQRFTATTVGGLGFIALAVLIFGRHRPFGIIMAGLVFGFSKNLGAVISTIAPKLPAIYFDILPYVATIVVLLIFSRNKKVEMESLGIAYDKELR